MERPAFSVGDAELKGYNEKDVYFAWALHVVECKLLGYEPYAFNEREYEWARVILKYKPKYEGKISSSEIGERLLKEEAANGNRCKEGD